MKVFVRRISALPDNQSVATSGHGCWLLVSVLQSSVTEEHQGKVKAAKNKQLFLFFSTAASIPIFTLSKSAWKGEC